MESGSIQSESPRICDTCRASSHCSQLRLALEILGDSLAQAKNATTCMRYQEIVEQLKERGWQYPESHHICLLAEKENQIRSLTDELIKLSKELSPKPYPPPDPGPSHTETVDLLTSLFDEETSCE